MMKNYTNVGKTRNLAQSLLLIEHQKRPFSQTFQPDRLSKSLPTNHLAILPQSQKSAFFCYFLLKFCIYAEFPSHPSFQPKNHPIICYLSSTIYYLQSEKYHTPYTINRKLTRSCIPSGPDLDGLDLASCINRPRCFSLDLPDTWLYHSAFHQRPESGAEK